MIDGKTKFSIYYPDEVKKYVCTIRHVGKGEYYADDIETDLMITDFDTEDIVELMFTHKLERKSRITGRTELFAEAIK